MLIPMKARLSTSIQVFGKYTRERHYTSSKIYVLLAYGGLIVNLNIAVQYYS